MKKLMFAAIVTLAMTGAAQAGDGMPICPEYHKAWTYGLSDWMSTIPDKTPLGRITMPSSHDAGMDEHVMTHDRSVWSTQFYRLKVQMEYGARYFDVRIEKDHTAGHERKFRAYHGDGGTAIYAYYLNELLDDAVAFVTAHPNETVILKFSHWDNDNDVWDALSEIYSNSGWTGHFHKAPSGTTEAPPCLNETPLSDLRGKIVFLLDFHKDATDDEPADARDSTIAKNGYGPDRGVWRFADLRFNSSGYHGYYRVYDYYAGTDNMGTMKSDQSGKWKSFDGKYAADGNAFMLCWQLTYGGNPRSNYTRAAEINPSLDLYMQNETAAGRSRPRLVNIDYVDEHVCVPIINYNAELIEGLDLSVAYLSPLFDASGAVSGFETRRCEKKSYIEVTGDDKDGLAMANAFYVFRSGSLTLTHGVSVSGDVKIILCNGANVTADGSNTSKIPGIKVPSGSTLTIYAQTTESSAMGSLSAYGRDNDHAGIGCGKGTSAGTVVINGGRIYANGSKYAAGIGGGHESANGAITINGGEVTAVSAEYGAGIGSGKRSVHQGHYPGAITINGGIVSAYSSGDGKGAGIGGGEDCPGYGITINGGTVTATGKHFGAGIGGGDDGDGYEITINGGYVTATGDGGSAGIGGGQAGDDDDGHGCGYAITINGGTVFATGSYDESPKYGRAHDIGNGTRNTTEKYPSHDIRFTGGSIHASSFGVTPKNASSSSVYAVAVNDVQGGSPVSVVGLDFYGVRDLYLNEEGELRLWLPNGTYSFWAGDIRYGVTVNGAGATAAVQEPVDPAVTYESQAAAQTAANGAFVARPTAAVEQVVSAKDYDAMFDKVVTERSPGSWCIVPTLNAATSNKVCQALGAPDALKSLANTVTNDTPMAMVKTRAGLRYGMVGTTDLRKGDGADAPEWTLGDGGVIFIKGKKPTSATDRVFYRLKAKP